MNIPWMTPLGLRMIHTEVNHKAIYRKVLEGLITAITKHEEPIESTHLPESAHPTSTTLAVGTARTLREYFDHLSDHQTETVVNSLALIALDLLGQPAEPTHGSNHDQLWPSHKGPTDKSLHRDEAQDIRSGLSYLDLSPPSTRKPTLDIIQDVQDAHEDIQEIESIELNEDSGELFLKCHSPISKCSFDLENPDPETDGISTPEDYDDGSTERPSTNDAPPHPRLEDIDLDAEFGQSATDLDEWEEEVAPQLPSEADDAPTFSRLEDLDLDAVFQQSATDLDEWEEETVPQIPFEIDSAPHAAFVQTETEATAEQGQYTSSYGEDHIIGNRLACRYLLDPSAVTQIEYMIRANPINKTLWIQANEYWQWVKYFTNNDWWNQGCPAGMLPRSELQESDSENVWRELLGLAPKITVHSESNSTPKVHPVHHYNILDYPIHSASQTPPDTSFLITLISTRKKPVDDGTSWKAVVSAQAAKWIDPVFLHDVTSTPDGLLENGTVSALEEFIEGRAKVHYEPWGSWQWEKYDNDEAAPAGLSDQQRQGMHAARDFSCGYPGLQRPHRMNPEQDGDIIINDDGIANPSTCSENKKKNGWMDSMTRHPSKLCIVSNVDDEMMSHPDIDASLEDEMSHDDQNDTKSSGQPSLEPGHQPTIDCRRLDGDSKEAIDSCHSLTTKNISFASGENYLDSNETTHASAACVGDPDPQAWNNHPLVDASLGDQLSNIDRNESESSGQPPLNPGHEPTVCCRRLGPDDTEAIDSHHALAIKDISFTADGNDSDVSETMHASTACARDGEPEAPRDLCLFGEIEVNIPHSGNSSLPAIAPIDTQASDSPSGDNASPTDDEGYISESWTSVSSDRSDSHERQCTEANDGEPHAVTDHPDAVDDEVCHSNPIDSGSSEDSNRLEEHALPDLPTRYPEAAALPLVEHDSTDLKHDKAHHTHDLVGTRDPVRITAHDNIINRKDKPQSSAQDIFLAVGYAVVELIVWVFWKSLW